MSMPITFDDYDGYIAEVKSLAKPKEEVKKMEESFPAFQWSIFLKNGRDEQLVVRANTFEEFEARRLEVLNKVIAWTNAQPASVVTPQVVPVQDSPVPVCPVHGKPMRMGKYGPYCATKLPDGSWCKAKPQA